MTERKPAHLDSDTWVEVQIRAAQQRGEFDDLPDAGKPLPGVGEPVEDLWWVKGYLRRETLSAELTLPASLQLRRQVERLPDEVRELPSERMVRDVTKALNERIAQWLSAPSGPWFAVGPVDADEVVRQWRSHRQTEMAKPAVEDPSPPTRVAAGGGWWRSLTRPLRRRHAGGTDTFRG
ncbi:DUF1992 domain-containing protein [Solwaraspora sp. WMMB335]|uniref:DnaJ family domain-containing protein n=1 Tax=Solwaraspora sp. WMMB335 TaxID=3404118 RepID=UPI003B938FF8